MALKSNTPVTRALQYTSHSSFELFSPLFAMLNDLRDPLKELEIEPFVLRPRELPTGSW